MNDRNAIIVFVLWMLGNIVFGLIICNLANRLDATQEELKRVEIKLDIREDIKFWGITTPKPKP